MREIVFATNNAHKLRELRQIVEGSGLRILSLGDIGCHEDIPETALTIEGNAELKARYVKENYGYDCFADDTGLEIKALGGQPGVHTARYAGEECDSEKNIDKVLKNLRGASDRSARFRTAIALVTGDSCQIFEGEVRGDILTERRGSAGFGYDPIFKPVEADCSFAEMSSEQKNSISHRARAVAAMLKSDFFEK